MKRRTLVALLVTAAVIGGMLLLFPAEWVGLLIALLILLTAQAALILRHTRVVPGAADSSPRPRFSTSMLQGQSVARRSAAPAADAAPSVAPAEAPAGAATVPAPDVFSRFRAHLETMERGAPRAAEAPPAVGEAGRATQAEGDTVADRVELSSAAKGQAGAGAQAAASSKHVGPTEASPPAAIAESRGAGTVATGAPSDAPPQPPRIGAAQPRKAGAARGPARPELSEMLKAGGHEDEEPDLFADLRPDIAVGRAGPAGGKSAETAMPAAPPRDEVGEALARAREPQAIRDEGAALVRIAEEALDSGNLSHAKALLDQYEALVSDAPALASWEAARAQLRLAAREARPEAVAPLFQAMLDRGYAPREESLDGEIDALLDGIAPESKAPAKVALLVKALAPFRQAGDRAALDRLYARIEAAQETASDPRRLIQFYKNHLAIKEALGDVKGQLSLIDHIGNRYFQLGDTAPAKEFYEKGMKLRLEMEQARSAVGAEAGAARGEPAAGRSAGDPADKGGGR